ncbi:MAG: class I SAM-dependent methyltransferase [Sedimentisphaerales bacterium]|nr:class I SAM-dependent methyltransferase [Sedimentisphaerales bacterium]
MPEEVLWFEQRKCLVFIENKATPSFWSDRWETGMDWKTKITRSRQSRYWSKILKKYLPDKSARIIEGGCGYGHLVDAMDYWGYKAVGVDFAAETVAKIKEVMPQLDVRVGDVRNLQFEDDYFDGYWSLGVIEHFWDGYQEILAEMYRVLKPGGYALVTFPSVSLADRIRKSCGGYKKYNQSVEPEDFYQFALNPRDVIKDFEKLGFEYITISSRNGFLGLERVLPCTKGIFAKTVEFAKKGLFAKIVVHAISFMIAPICGSGVLMVMRKKDRI